MFNHTFCNGYSDFFKKNNLKYNLNLEMEVEEGFWVLFRS